MILQARRVPTTHTTSSKNFSEIEGVLLAAKAGYHHPYQSKQPLTRCLCRNLTKTTTMSPASKPSSSDSIGNPGITTTTTPAVLVMVCCTGVCSAASSPSIVPNCSAIPPTTGEGLILGQLLRMYGRRMGLDRSDSTFSTEQLTAPLVTRISGRTFAIASLTLTVNHGFFFEALIGVRELR
jgi:hypothetical protein